MLARVSALPCIVVMCRNTPSRAVSQTSRLIPTLNQSTKNNIVQIVSQNTRGLKADDRLEELFSSINRRGILASCIQETWRSGLDILEHGQCTLVLAGLDPTEQTCNRGSQGVGIALSSRAVDAWRAAGSELHNDLGARIIAVRLLMKDYREQDIGLFIVSAYAPIGSADENIWENFFDG